MYLVKTNHYLRRVTGVPSSKTSYVIVGANAGPSKLATIKKNGLKTLDEDGFLNLIGTRYATSQMKYPNLLIQVVRRCLMTRQKKN
jgi:BRCT domain type II-containing protein